MTGTLSTLFVHKISATPSFAITVAVPLATCG